MAQEQITRRSEADRKLETRVRALVAKQVSHPGAIAVYVEKGTVTLGGPIAASELTELRDAVMSLEGVDALLDHLEVHETGEGAPEFNQKVDAERDAAEVPVQGTEEGTFEPVTV
jgi:osmotically-inducible protein OsmY